MVMLSPHPRFKYPNVKIVTDKCITHLDPETAQVPTIQMLLYKREGRYIIVIFILIDTKQFRHNKFISSEIWGILKDRPVINISFTKSIFRTRVKLPSSTFYTLIFVELYLSRHFSKCAQYLLCTCRSITLRHSRQSHFHPFPR